MPKPIIELSAHECRFPVDGGFCAEHAPDGSYCAHHYRIAYEPLTPAQRKRDARGIAYIIKRGL